MSKVTLVLREEDARRLLIGLIMNANHQLPDDLRQAADRLRDELQHALGECDCAKIGHPPAPLTEVSPGEWR